MCPHSHLHTPSKGFDPDTPLSSGWPPLLHACDNCQESIVKLLLDRGASPNASKGKLDSLLVIIIIMVPVTSLPLASQCPTQEICTVKSTVCNITGHFPTILPVWPDNFSIGWPFCPSKFKKLYFMFLSWISEWSNKVGFGQTKKPVKLPTTTTLRRVFILKRVAVHFN